MMKPLILAAIIDASGAGIAGPMTEQMAQILDNRNYEIVDEKLAQVFVIVSAEGDTYAATVSVRHSAEQPRPEYVGQWMASCEDPMTPRLCAYAAAANVEELVDFALTSQP